MPYLVAPPNAPNPKSYTLVTGSNSIGRGLDNHIVLMHPSLSRHHAELKVQENGQAILKDLDSLNHTYVNDQPIQQCQLKDGDRVRFGTIDMQITWNLTATIPEPTSPNPPPDQSLSIISRFAPENTRIELQDLLEPEAPGESGVGLKLKQQDDQTRSVDKLKILLEVSQQLSSPKELEELLDKILDLLFEIMTVDRGLILLVNPQTQELEQKAIKFRSGIPTGLRFYSTTITNFVYESGEGILTDDAARDRRFHESRSIVQQAIHAAMCVPLKPRDEVIGVLYTDNLSIRSIYSEEDLEFLAGLANQAAIAIDNAHLYKKIQTEAVLRTKLERFFPQNVWRKLSEESQLEVIDTKVTVVFADISRFTELSSRLEPRQVITMLNEYFSVMVEGIVFRFEGTLEQYIGDALLAVWGAPYQHPNDAERAVKAAIAMQNAVSKLNQRWAKRWNFNIQIHIGVNTGVVAAGNIGSEQLFQYGTIGNTTNISSRICDVARAGEILISQSTLNELHQCDAPLQQLTPVQVKGIQDPIQLYRLLWNQKNPPAQGQAVMASKP
ncbi:adenylate/guanylate cyclase domain-containing protein [Acaryochloris marina NIES-2412]|uniref:adenylate/guanylate cyclase domain-containing protein n=1 Tax=Acaryochloris marina TaxID=155978 RepID=UPI004057F2FB